jgi:protein-disulfide isomerase
VRQVSDLTSAPVPALAEREHVRGPEGAPLVIVYADFTCPQCAVAAERLRAAPVRTCFRHFAVRARHPRAVPLAHMLEAASRQGGFWDLHDAVYADQGRIDDPHIWAHAERLGLDLGRLEAERRDPAVIELVEGDVRSALRAGAATTPTLFVDGVLHAGAPDPDLLKKVTQTA